MKAIMISIRPKYVADILNGRKTIEIRKTMPKCDLPIEVYIYCCKRQRNEIGCHINYKSVDGKVVAKFTLNKVELIEHSHSHFYFSEEESKKMLYEGLIERLGCISADNLHLYLKGKNGYAWHIDNLVIFDKPKEMSEFRQCKEKKCPYSLPCHNHCHSLIPLTKAPQSWQFIEVER